MASVLPSKTSSSSQTAFVARFVNSFTNGFLENWLFSEKVCEPNRKLTVYERVESFESLYI